MKLTFSQVKPLVARVMGVCESDARVASYTNEACRRLLNKGLWAGCYGRFTINTTNGCITWPRLIETIESVATCCSVGQVRNQWFEFLETGYGLLDSKSCVGNQLVDRGTVVTYRDMTGGTTSYLRLYPGDSSDVGKTAILQGYDENGNWIRTEVDGTWIDGEQVTLALPYVQTDNKFIALTGVIRQSTNTVSRLYEYDGTDEYDLAVYDPDETVPQYRRSLLPGLCSATDNTPVTVMAKLRHVDVAVDNDYVIPPCPDAIKLMVKAILKEENELIEEAAVYEMKAEQTLREQTMHHLGDAQHTIKTVGVAQWGGGLSYMM